MLQLSVTALFYLEDSRKIHLRGVRAHRSKDTRRRTPQHMGERERERAHGRWGERERERALAPPFICFSSTWACPMKIWLSQECCLFYLKSSLWSWDLFLVLFSRACLLATAILDSFSLFYLPNSNPLQHSCLENPITRGVW